MVSERRGAPVMNTGKKKQDIASRGIVFYVMLIINLILAVCVAVIVVVYATRNTTSMKNMSDQKIMDDATTTVSQLESYIGSQDWIAKSYASYIRGEIESMDQLVKYLEYWKIFYKQIDIVSIEDYEGVRLIGDEDSGILHTLSFADNDNVRQVCDDYELLVQGNVIQMSDVFYVDGVGDAMMSFYQPITVEGVKRVLFFVIPVTALKDSGINAEGADSKRGLIINKDGDIIYGPAKDLTVQDNSNFYDFVSDKLGRERAEQIRDEVNDSSAGICGVTDKKGREWLCTYRKIEGAKDWIYIYYQEEHENLQNASVRTVVVVFVFMALWLLLDVVVYFWYNKRLRNSLKIIEKQNEELQDANQAKNTFISNMSHEIRTPINAVLGMDEMILREAEDDNIRSYAADIKNAGKVLLGLINDVLDYSKIDSGKMEIICNEYDVGSLVNDIYNMISMRMKDKEIQLEMIVEPTIPRLLYGDELRIKQIILNILTNAVKYTEKGKVTFSMDFVNLDSDYMNLMVSVKDTGIGMKKEELDKLFVAFERLDEKRNRNIEGTGLGMSIVTKLLGQMGSKLEVESEYGVGSCFSFKLRQKVMNRRGVGGIGTILQRREVREVDKEAILRASAAKILVVDDTPVNLTVIQGLLKRTRVHIQTAQSGEECLKKLEEEHFDLILLDHRMPKMDGIETIHQIREGNTDNRDIPVIALTANVVSGAHEMYIREGFSDFLSKPVSGNRLERMMLKYLPEECLDSEEEIYTSIDEEEGISACGSEEVYSRVLKEFLALAQKNIEEMRTLFSQRDLENLTIKVHALKSSARLAGALSLSGEAARLEEEGNRQNWDGVAAGIDKLLEHYEKTAAAIRAGIGEDTQDKPEASAQEFIEGMLAVREFNDAFDYDSIDVVMDTLDGYAIPDVIKDDYDKLKNAIYEVHQKQIGELALVIQKKMEGSALQ